ncbi:MAG: hypothetical protein GF418_03550 [Chitinivibrionales bacterium]|nr:hypothetical protein [Chitinivibrionales bacterium]MBD3394679.1 hypothetical protein [Chitinivibrionales bacterium]
MLSLALTACAAWANADQFVVIDTLFEFILQDNPPYHIAGAAVQSHYNLLFGSEVPTDWSDYSSGHIYVRLEIHEMPEGQPKGTAMQLCMNNDNPQGSGNTIWHTCVTCTWFYSSGDVRRVDQAANAWFVYPQGSAQWNNFGVGYPQMVVKEGEGCGIPICTGCMWSNWAGYPNLNLYYPITLRVTAIMVSNGGTFDEPEYWQSDDFIGTGTAGRRTRAHPASGGMEVRRLANATVVSLRNASIARAAVFAADGSEVRSGWRLHEGRVALEAGILPGTYLIRVTDSGGNRSARVVIKQ